MLPQSATGSFPKQPIYTAPPKKFQPYVPSTMQGGNSSSQYKFTEAKSDDTKKFTYPSGGLMSSGGITSPKMEMTQQKSIPSFLQGRNAMKGSMIGTEIQSFAKVSKYDSQTYSTGDSQNGRKTPRMSDHPDMKFSSIEFGTDGYKIPSFLNKQKKVPYSNSGSERPESTKQPIIPKQAIDTTLNSSYGNLKRKGSGSNSSSIQHRDPTAEWVKKSWSKRKQKVFSINDFQQIKQLGQGKYGRVYLARQKQTHFICALKILQKALIKQQEITEQLIRELKIQSFLNHTNLMKMYGFFDDATNIYLIMQAATGGQLYKQLKKHQSMPQTKVASIMRQVCQAINQLHSNRIIHRDIKPENIVLHDNVIKLCDFGWSVYCDSSLRTTFCGTPLYVGPQILKGKQYDQKIDIWSLGVMMYEIMVGENPFKITKEQELIKIIKDEIKIPSYVQISEEGKSFIFACLQKNPQDRLSIRELMNHQFFKKYPQKNDKKLGL